MRRLLVSVLLLAPLLISPRTIAEERFPPGRSTQQMGDVRYEMLVPTAEQAKDGYSLLVILHGSGGTATGMVGVGQELLDLGFVTCAPKSIDPRTWSNADLPVVREITAKLIKMYDVPEHRRHAAGFSNGGWNLTPVAFDEDLHFRTATWMAAGYRGGKPPRWAAREMGCLALAGEQDGNRDAAGATVGMLEKKVKFVDCRIQPDLGHEFPRKLEPYWHYVMEVMEGRFTPGDQRSYDWESDLAAGRRRMESLKVGGFAYIWSEEADEKETELMRLYQNELLFDRLVGYFGRQLAAVKLESTSEEAQALIADERIKKTPAIVVWRRGGKKVQKVLTGKLSVRKLMVMFRSVARNKRLPD